MNHFRLIRDEAYQLSNIQVVLKFVNVHRVMKKSAPALPPATNNKTFILVVIIVYNFIVLLNLPSLFIMWNS